MGTDFGLTSEDQFNKMDLQKTTSVSLLQHVTSALSVETEKTPCSFEIPKLLANPPVHFDRGQDSLRLLSSNDLVDHSRTVDFCLTADGQLEKTTSVSALQHVEITASTLSVKAGKTTTVEIRSFGVPFVTLPPPTPLTKERKFIIPAEELHLVLHVI